MRYQYLKKYMCIGLSSVLMASPVAAESYMEEANSYILASDGVERYDSPGEPVAQVNEQTDGQTDGQASGIVDLQGEQGESGEQGEQEQPDIGVQQEPGDQIPLYDDETENTIVLDNGDSGEEIPELSYASEDVTVYASRADGLPFEAGTSIYIASFSELFSGYSADNRDLIYHMVDNAVLDEIFELSHICGNKHALTPEEKEYLYKRYDGLLVEGKRFLPVLTDAKGNYITNLDIFWTFIFKNGDRVAHFADGTQSTDVFFMTNHNMSNISNLNIDEADIIEPINFYGVSYENNNDNYIIQFKGKEDVVMFYTANLNFVPKEVQQLDMDTLTNNPDVVVNEPEPEPEPEPEKTEQEVVPETKPVQEAEPESVTGPESKTETQKEPEESYDITKEPEQAAPVIEFPESTKEEKKQETVTEKKPEQKVETAKPESQTIDVNETQTIDITGTETKTVAGKNDKTETKPDSKTNDKTTSKTDGSSNTNSTTQKPSGKTTSNTSGNSGPTINNTGSSTNSQYNRSYSTSSNTSNSIDPYDRTYATTGRYTRTTNPTAPTDAVKPDITNDDISISSANTANNANNSNNSYTNSVNSGTAAASSAAASAGNGAAAASSAAAGSGRGASNSTANAGATAAKTTTASGFTRTAGTVANGISNSSTGLGNTSATGSSAASAASTASSGYSATPENRPVNKTATPVSAPSLIKIYYPCPWNINTDYSAFGKLIPELQDADMMVREWVTDYDKANDVPLWLDLVSAIVSPLK